MKTLFIAIATALLLTGCQTSTSFYIKNEDGVLEEIAYIKQDSPGKALYTTEKDGKKFTVEVDTRDQGSWFTRHITPIFQRSTEAAAGIR